MTIRSDVSLGDFLRTLKLGHIWKSIEAEGDHEPLKALEDDFSRICRDCQDASGVACSLFQRRPQGVPDATVKQLVGSSLWAASGVELSLCKIVSDLLDMTETATERKFYEMYFQYCLRWSRPREVLERAYRGELVDPVLRVEPGDWTWMWNTHWSLLNLLGQPALIPQVVLNLIVTGDLPNDHPDKNFYDSNVGRVDFYFVSRSRKHIVEIDGGYHHRSEEEFTRLLKRDRTLRRQGYVVHRFSNLEVTKATDFDEFARELF